MTSEVTMQPRPIRITYIISAINTENAGTEGHLLRLLRNLDRKKFSPQLIVMQRSAWTDQFSEPEIPMHVLDFKSFMRPKDWNIVSRITKLLRDQNPDVVELHFIDAHFAGALACRRAKVPVVLSCRRDLGHQYGFKGTWLMKLGNPFVTRFIANAKLVAQAMSKLEGIDAKKFDVIYNGIDLVAFDEKANGPVLQEFVEQTQGRRVVSIAANLRPVKNVPLFLDAMAIVAKQVPDVIFALMGDGSLRAALEQQAHELGIADRTLFLGSVPSVAPYLKRSHVACLTSHAEGFSNSVVEYMASSLPVVVTEVGGLPEAVIPEQTGFVVPPGDKDALASRVVHLLQLPEEDRQKMGVTARQRVEAEFTMQRQLEQHEELYERYLSST